MLDVSQAWKNAARISRRSVVLVRLYYGPGESSDYLALGSESMVLGGVHYRGLLAKGALPSTEMGLDIKDHTVQISTTKMKVNNGEYNPGKRFSDFIGDTSLGTGDDWGFENRLCKIRLWTEGITTWADCVQQFEGLIRDLDHDDKVVMVPLQSRQELVYQEIGERVTDAGAADPGQGLPEESRGKIKPRIYGDHTFLKGNDAKSLDTAISANNLTPCLYMGLDSSGSQRWLIAGHKVDEILAAAGDQVQLWGKDPSTSRFVRLHNALGTDVTVVQNTSAGCIVSVVVGFQKPAFHDYWYGRGTVTPTRSGGDVDLFSDPERVIDKSMALVSSATITDAANSSDWTQIVVPFPIWDNKIADASIVAVLMEWYGKISYPTGDFADFTLSVNGVDQHGAEPEGAGYPEARVEGNVNNFTSDQAGISDDCTLKLAKDTDADEEAEIDIYEIYKEITFVPEEILPLFFAGKAGEYPEAPGWINDRTQTEPHADNDQAESLIENPAGVQESILRDELGEGDSEIDLAAFNVASNDVAAWKMAPAIIKERGSKGLLAELGRESRSFVWPGPDGKWKMRVLEDTYSAADIVLDCKRAIGEVKFTRTPLKDLVTSVTGYYDYNGERYLSKTGAVNDTRMQDKWNVTGTQSKRFPKANHLHDKATTEAWRDYFLAMWKQPHIGFVGLWGVEAVHADVADIAELLNPPYKPYGLDVTQNNPVAGQDVLKYWWILNVRRQADRIRIRGFQLHDLG